MFDTLPKKTVLLVEDHVDSREILALLLEQSGMNVITAGDGIEALGALLKKAPDIIVTDLRMPNMNGIEFAQLVKATTAYRRIPMILITATPPSDIFTYPQFARILQKPCSLAVLIDAINVTIG